MGANVEICCKNCGYSKDFITGVGYLYSPQNLRNFDSDFAILPGVIHSKKTLAYIKELLTEKNAEIANGYGHKIFRCVKCGELFERFYIRLNYDEGIYEVAYKCPRCKGSLKPIDLVKIRDCPCPKCGQLTLQEDERFFILWD